MTNNKPVLKLSGNDGNVFMILGLAGRAARKAKWTKDQIDAYMTEAKSGDYDHVIQVTMKYFEVE